MMEKSCQRAFRIQFLKQFLFGCFHLQLNLTFPDIEIGMPDLLLSNSTTHMAVGDQNTTALSPTEGDVSITTYCVAPQA